MKDYAKGMHLFHQGSDACGSQRERRLFSSTCILTVQQDINPPPPNKYSHACPKVFAIFLRRLAFVQTHTRPLYNSLFLTVHKPQMDND